MRLVDCDVELVERLVDCDVDCVMLVEVLVVVVEVELDVDNVVDVLDEVEVVVPCSTAQPTIFRAVPSAVV